MRFLNLIFIIFIIMLSFYFINIYFLRKEMKSHNDGMKSHKGGMKSHNDIGMESHNGGMKSHNIMGRNLIMPPNLLHFKIIL